MSDDDYDRRGTQELMVKGRIKNTNWGPRPASCKGASVVGGPSLVGHSSTFRASGPSVVPLWWPR